MNELLSRDGPNSKLGDMRSIILLFCASVALTAAQPVRVYLVRHAEAAGAVMGVPAPGPSLSEAGKQRADALARTLIGAHIKQIYVSPYARTQETAARLAAKLHLKPIVEQQDAPSQERIAHDVRSMPAGSAVLIVGHSNTIPGIIGQLGASPVPVIKEGEFNKLFVVTVTGNNAKLETRSYGKATPQRAAK